MKPQDKRFTPSDDTAAGTSSNVPLLLIATAFLCVTIVLVLLQPRLGGTLTEEPAVIAAAEPDQKPKAPAAPVILAEPKQSVPEEQEQVVSRAQVPLLQAPPPAKTDAAKAISKQLRQPIRLTSTTATPLDLPSLTRGVLGQFDTSGLGLDEDLHRLIVEAVLQRQSDTYISVLLNTAADRGQISIPATLRTASGSFDTRTLLTTMVDAAGGAAQNPSIQLTGEARHLIDAHDSLAGIALRYYGDALVVHKILDANPSIDAARIELRPGETVRLPKL